MVARRGGPVEEEMVVVGDAVEIRSATEPVAATGGNCLGPLIRF